MKEYLGPYELNSIVVGDSMKLCDDIPDDSVHLIMCDPVYWEMDQYHWLASLSARVLVDGGNVVAQTGSHYRFDAEKAMSHPDLVRRPLLAERYTGGYGQMWVHRSLDAWGPYIWMTKGDKVERERWVHTLVSGGKDKGSHVWGDGTRAFSLWMSAMTNEGDIVLDPFTGGGTVPATAKMLNRRWLAFEIDEDTALDALSRLNNTQNPLLVAEVETVIQPPLLLED